MRFSSNQAIHKSSGPPEHASTVPSCPRSDDVTGQARDGGTNATHDASGMVPTRVATGRGRRALYMVEVICLMCSRAVGVLISLCLSLPAATPFRGQDGAIQPAVAWRRPRCSTCGGNTYQGDISLHWVYGPVDWLSDRPRRGRPPKRLTLPEAYA